MNRVKGLVHRKLVRPQLVVVGILDVLLRKMHVLAMSLPALVRVILPVSGIYSARLASAKSTRVKSTPPRNAPNRLSAHSLRLAVVLIVCSQAAQLNCLTASLTTVA